jgi:hypothetical protein
MTASCSHVTSMMMALGASGFPPAPSNLGSIWGSLAEVGEGVLLSWEV